MAILGIIFRQQRVVINPTSEGKPGALGTLQGILRQVVGGVGGIVLDCTVSEDHSDSCTVTDNPVERGADISDHVRVMAPKLTIEGMISDHPLGYAIIGNIQNVIRSVATLFGKKSRSIDAYDELLALKNSRQPFKVLTGYRKYDNMVIEDLTVHRDSTTGQSLQFTAVMRQVEVATSKTLDNLNLASGVKNLAFKRRDLGQKVTDPVPAASMSSEVSSTLTNQSIDPTLAGIFN